MRSKAGQQGGGVSTGLSIILPEYGKQQRLSEQDVWTLQSRKEGQVQPRRLARQTAEEALMGPHVS